MTARKVTKGDARWGNEARKKPVSALEGGLAAGQPGLSWKPRLRAADGRCAAIYCSPACGGGCTRAAFERAKEDAAKLCARLGPGWTPHVWENLGWHWCAKSPEGGVATVRPPRPPGTRDWSAHLGEFWCFGRTPEAALVALRDQLLMDLQVRSARARSVDALVDALKRKPRRPPARKAGGR